MRKHFLGSPKLFIPKIVLSFITVAPFLSGCMSLTAASVGASAATVAAVAVVEVGMLAGGETVPVRGQTGPVLEREIRIGMSGSEVAEILGSPNVVHTDEQGRKVWIYDNIAPATAYSMSEEGVRSLVIRGEIDSSSEERGLMYGASSGDIYKSQRTQTVAIKFNSDRKVSDFSY